VAIFTSQRRDRIKWQQLRYSYFSNRAIARRDV